MPVTRRDFLSKTAKAAAAYPAMLALGDDVICLDEKTKTYTSYKVFNKTEAAGGLQKVYNMEVSAGSTFIMNGVMVLQK